MPMQGAFPHGRLGVSRQTEVAPGFRLCNPDEPDPFGIGYVRVRSADIVFVSSDGLRYVGGVEYIETVFGDDAIYASFRNVLVPAPGALCEMTFPG